MIRRSDAIAVAERQVTEARMAVFAEYDAARARLRRRTSSPVFIGGVLLGAIALGYLAFGRAKPRLPVCRESPGRRGAWSRAGRTAQVLLPLLIALNSATKAARAPRAGSSGTES